MARTVRKPDWAFARHWPTDAVVQIEVATKGGPYGEVVYDVLVNGEKVGSIRKWRTTPSTTHRRIRYDHAERTVWAHVHPDGRRRPSALWVDTAWRAVRDLLDEVHR